MVTLDGSSLTTADVARVLFDFEETAASEESMERVKKAERQWSGLFTKKRQYTALPPDLANSVMS